jgi:hypothetical protein
MAKKDKKLNEVIDVIDTPVFHTGCKIGTVEPEHFDTNEDRKALVNLLSFINGCIQKYKNFDEFNNGDLGKDMILYIEDIMKYYRSDYKPNKNNAKFDNYDTIWTFKGDIFKNVIKNGNFKLTSSLTEKEILDNKLYRIYSLTDINNSSTNIVVNFTEI